MSGLFFMLQSVRKNFYIALYEWSFLYTLCIQVYDNVQNNINTTSQLHNFTKEQPHKRTTPQLHKSFVTLFFTLFYLV